MVACCARRSLVAVLTATLLVLLGAGSAAWAWSPVHLWTSMTDSIGLGHRPSRPAMDELTQFMRALAEPPGDTVALGAHAGTEGHWTFLNRRGETFTVGTPEEMARLIAALAPEAPAKAALRLYVSAETVFERTPMLAELPAGASRHVVIDLSRSFALVRGGLPGSQTWRAIVRPRLQVEIGTRAAFHEALRQLDRALEKARLRLLALTPAGPGTLARSPKPDATTGRPPPDPVDPLKLAAALFAIDGQTAVISGRITDKLVAFRPATGPELTLIHADLVAAAARAGVDLMIVQSQTPYQPGARNWLWQRFEIDGLGKALARATLADALETLGGAREPVLVSLSAGAGDRVVMRAGPPQGLPAGGDGLGGILQEVTASITGSVSPTAIELHLTSMDRRRELSLRLLPLVPSSLQTAYLLALAIGALGAATAWRWWGRLWPAEARADYAGPAGYAAAVIARGATFLALFLPLAGLPALLVTLWRLPGRGLAALIGRRDRRERAVPPLAAG